MLDPGSRGFCASLATLTQLRRLASSTRRARNRYPIITFPVKAWDADRRSNAGRPADRRMPALWCWTSSARRWPMRCSCCVRTSSLTRRSRSRCSQVSTDQQPTADSPLMVTTNFSITYFSVANDRQFGQSRLVLVADAEGMSVLTAWAAGKFDASVIAKASEHRRRRQDRPTAASSSRSGGRPVGRVGRGTPRLGDQSRPA